MLDKKYLDKSSNILYIILYKTGNEFIKEVIDNIYDSIDNKSDIKKMTLDILEFALSREKVEIKTNFFEMDEKIYNKNNYNDILKRLDEEWDFFIEKDNFRFHYGYFIYFTDTWKKELMKLGVL